MSTALYVSLFAQSLQDDSGSRVPFSGWIRFWEFSQLVGRCCGYLLPKQGGGASQIKVNPTKVLDSSHPVYITHFSTIILWQFEGLSFAFAL